MDRHTASRRTVLGGSAAVAGGALLGALGVAHVDHDPVPSGFEPPVPVPGGSRYRLTAGRTTLTLDPRNGPVQRIVLSPPVHPDVFTANTVAVSVARRGGPWALLVDLQQDRTGGRYVTWRNVRWRDLVVPALDGRPGTTTTVQLWSVDGRTVWGASGQHSFAGVDPVTVPSIGGVWEAWSQPATAGQSLSPISPRTGTQLVVSGTAPTLVANSADTRSLGSWERGRMSMAFRTGGSATAVVGVRAKQGWTLVASFNGPGHGGDISLASLYTRDLSRSVSLELTSETPYVRVGTATFSNYNDLYRSVRGVIVVTLIQPANGGPGILRWNGLQVNATAPWSQPGALDHLVLNDLAPGPYRHQGYLHYGSVVFSPQPLPYAAPTDPVPLIERWAAAGLGSVV